MGVLRGRDNSDARGKGDGHWVGAAAETGAVTVRCGRAHIGKAALVTQHH